MPVFRAYRLPFAAAVSLLALSGGLMSAHAQSRPDLDALVYGAAAKAATPQPVADPQPVVQQAPRGLFTSSSASTSFSGGALAAIGGMFKRTPRQPQPLDAQASMAQSAPAASGAPNELDLKAYGATPDPVAPPTSQRGLLTGAKFASSSNGALSAIGSGFRSRRNAVVPARYAPPPPPPIVVAYDPTYRLDAGDRLRIVVYGQDGLTNTYQIGAAGTITMPLIGGVSARGQTTAELAATITSRLRDGFIREPSVAAEIEAYRPFFILGEVAAPGQYPYVPNMSVESAIAIAGGFSPRAKRDRVTLTHPMPEGLLRAVVPVGTPLSPGDTILVGERWF